MAESYPLRGQKWLLKLITRLHIALYRATRGTVGGMTEGLPNLLLTHRGRRSGRLFTTPLCCLPEGDGFVVVASYGGAPTDPDWWRNLKAEPRAWIEIGPHRLAVRAEQASEDLKSRLWPLFCRYYPGYVKYQARTQRIIPLVLLKREGTQARP